MKLHKTKSELFCQAVIKRHEREETHKERIPSLKTCRLAFTHPHMVIRNDATMVCYCTVLLFLSGTNTDYILHIVVLHKMMIVYAIRVFRLFPPGKPAYRALLLRIWSLSMSKA